MRSETRLMKENKPPENRLPAFRLTRYFSVACLIGICISVAGITMFYRQMAVESLTEHETRASVSVTQAFANSIWPSYGDFISGASSIPPEELASRAEIMALHTEVIRKMTGLDVIKVKIYNLDGLTVFSTDPTQIGGRQKH